MKKGPSTHSNAPAGVKFLHFVKNLRQRLPLIGGEKTERSKSSKNRRSRLGWVLGGLGTLAVGVIFSEDTLECAIETYTESTDESGEERVNRGTPEFNPTPEEQAKINTINTFNGLLGTFKADPNNTGNTQGVIDAAKLLVSDPDVKRMIGRAHRGKKINAKFKDEIEAVLENIQIILDEQVKDLERFEELKQVLEDLREGKLKGEGGSKAKRRGSSAKKTEGKKRNSRGSKGKPSKSKPKPEVETPITEEGKVGRRRRAIQRRLEQ